MGRKTLGFFAVDPKGFQTATFHAHSSDDVQRAMAIEWGDEAKAFRIERVPANTVGPAGGFENDRHYDLTGNEGWATLISAKEVDELAALNRSTP